MIRNIVDKIFVAISTETSTSDDSGREDALKLATAVLMVDVARADHVFDEAEFDQVLRLIESHFDIAPEAAAELVNAAGEQAEDLVSLHEFTQLLHQHLDEDE